MQDKYLIIRCLYVNNDASKTKKSEDNFFRPFVPSKALFVIYIVCGAPALGSSLRGIISARSDVL